MVRDYSPDDLEREGYELIDFVPRKNDDNSDSLETRLIFNKFNFSSRRRFEIKILRVICSDVEKDFDANYLHSCEYAKNYGNHFAIYIKPRDPAALERNILMYQFQEAYSDMLYSEDMSDVEKWDCYDKGDFYEPDDYPDFYTDDDELLWDEKTRRVFDKERGRKTLEDIMEFESPDKERVREELWLVNFEPQEECEESEYESLFEKDTYDMNRYDDEDSEEDWYIYGPGHIYGSDSSLHTMVDEEENEICWDEKTKRGFEGTLK